MEAWKYVIIVILGIICLFGILFTLLLLYRIITTKQTKIPKFILITTILSISSCSLCIGGDTFHIIKSLLIEDNDNIISSHFTLIMAITDILYYIASISFYIILIMRVYFSFQDSVYKLNKYFLYLLCILILASILLCIIYLITLFIYLPDGMKEFLNSTKWIAISFVIIWSSLDILLSIIFIYKLWQVIISLDIDIVNNNDNNNFDKIINLITRHCILFGLAIIANIIVLFAYIYLTFIINNIITILIFYISRTFENLFIIIALFLSLNINHFIYNKLCKYFHSCFLNCCIKKSYKKNKVSMQNYSNF